MGHVLTAWVPVDILNFIGEYLSAMFERIKVFYREYNIIVIEKDRTCVEWLLGEQGILR